MGIVERRYFTHTILVAVTFDNIIHKQVESLTAERIHSPKRMPLEPGNIPKLSPANCDQVGSKSEVNGLQFNSVSERHHLVKTGSLPKLLA